MVSQSKPEESNKVKQMVSHFPERWFSNWWVLKRISRNKETSNYIELRSWSFLFEIQNEEGRASLRQAESLKYLLSLVLFVWKFFSRNGITFWRCDFCFKYDACMNYLYAK